MEEQAVKREQRHRARSRRRPAGCLLMRADYGEVALPRVPPVLVSAPPLQDHEPDTLCAMARIWKKRTRVDREPLTES